MTHNRCIIGDVRDVLPAFAGDDDLEVYECSGCAGEISIVCAIWIDGLPYCCAECYARRTAQQGLGI